jgi:hypothetical protein
MHAIPLETVLGSLMRGVAGFGPRAVQVTSPSLFVRTDLRDFLEE